MPLANVEAWHTQAMNKATEFDYVSSVRAKFSIKGKETAESLYRDNMELALRQHLRKRNPKKYNDDWVQKQMMGASKTVREKFNIK